jgi:hypothetical protein
MASRTRILEWLGYFHGQRAEFDSIGGYAMPVNTEFRFDANLIIHRISGEFGVQEFRTTTSEELGHPEFRPGMDALWDFTQADISKVTSDDVRTMVQRMQQVSRQRGSGYRIAIVAPDDLTFGLSRMYEAQSAGLDREIRVFRDEKEALAWLAEPRQQKDSAH